MELTNHSTRVDEVSQSMPSGEPKGTLRKRIAAVIVVVLLTAGAEFAMGRKLWGVNGVPGFWSGDIWSEHNSQFVFDPYVFTHVTHGVVFYVLTGKRLVMTVAIEAAWEVVENSAPVIDRYRAETISLNYYGDSVVNSLFDILACITGFMLASRLPKRVTIPGTVALEIVLLIWIRDNLTLNIIMLISPSEAIRAWQVGKPIF
jgi:hypothetical protein